ncbi:MAG: hypothetical protein ACTHKU_08385, partial [Verrucomicrobiota bacterium]
NDAPARSNQWFLNEWRRWRSRKITVDTTNPLENRTDDGTLTARDPEHTSITETMDSVTLYPASSVVKTYSNGGDAENRDLFDKITSTEHWFDRGYRLYNDPGPGTNNGQSGGRGGPSPYWPEPDNFLAPTIHNRNPTIWDYTWTGTVANPDGSYQEQRITETRSDEYNSAPDFNRMLAYLNAQNLAALWTTPVRPYGGLLYRFGNSSTRRSYGSYWTLTNGGLQISQPASVNLANDDGNASTFTLPESMASYYPYDGVIYPLIDPNDPYGGASGATGGTSNNPVVMLVSHSATSVSRVQLKCNIRTDYTIFERVGFYDAGSPVISSFKYRVISTGTLEPNQIIELPEPSIREFPTIVAGTATNECVVGFLPMISLEDYLSHAGSYRGDIVSYFTQPQSSGSEASTGGEESNASES